MQTSESGGIHLREPLLGVPAASARPVASGSLWRDTLRSIRRQRSSVVGLGILISLALIALFADQLTPYGQQQDFIGLVGGKARAAPCIHLLGCPSDQMEHWFGLDGNFRDVFTRVIHGTRISLFMGFLSVGFAIVIGSMSGAIAGFAGGRIDTAIMRVMDVLLVFPGLLLAIAILTVLDHTLLNALLAIGLVAVPVYARIMRSSVITIREQDYITASRALGETPLRLLLRRVMPNALTTTIVAGTLGIGSAVLDISALSFIGLGADVRVPEWGTMIGLERNNVFAAPHLLFFPGIALTLAVLGYNLFGDGLRDALDPRLDK